MRGSTLLCTVVILFSAACKSFSQAENFNYKQVPAKYFENKLPDSLVAAAQKSIRNAFDATAMLPQGYVKNATVDYTAYIQQALNRHSIVLMPDFAVLVADTGLTLRSGQTLIFNKHSQVRLMPGSKHTYEIIRIHQAHNVTLYYPVIYGDKNTHTGTAGQWGMGIAVRASSNVTIVAPKVYHCWGDGIYIGQIEHVPAENVKIYNMYLDDNRRNGMSVTSVKGLFVSGGVVSNSNGQMPQSGIDIEPNFESDVIDNITIIN